MTLGLFVPRPSPIHHLPAPIKLAGLAIAGITVFWVSSPSALAALVGGALLLIQVARLPWATVAAQFRSLIWILAGIFILHALFTHWLLGVILVLRFTVLLLLATLVTLTTRVSDMVDALERSLMPLKPLGVNPGQVSLMIAIAIRLIPMLLDLIQEVQDAQRARGVDRPMITLFVPVLIRMLQLADHLAEALDARGYDADAQ